MHPGFPKRQHGATAVEFAVVAAFIFFPLLFGIMEFGRVFYLWNTLQEVTRHAARDAAVTDFTNAAAMSAVRQKAIFRTDAGALVGGSEVSDDSIAIAYLNSAMATVDLATTCPAKNVVTCNGDPNDAGCIRFVRVQICQPGTSCTPVQYSPMTGWLSFLSISMPPSDAIVPAESLGFRPNSPACY